MSKTFTYTKMTGHYYCQYSDDWVQDGVDFEYKVQDKQLIEEVLPLILQEYFSEEIDFYCNDNLWSAIKEKIKNIIEDNGLLDGLVDRYEDELKDIFYYDAMKEFDNR